MKKVKKVFKYGTGDVVPDGAIYLKTIVQEKIIKDIKVYSTFMGVKTKEPTMFPEVYPCWFVWHYFLVEVEE